MDIPDDLTVDVRDGLIKLASNGKFLTIEHGGRHGIFMNGPLPWSIVVERWLRPALSQLRKSAAAGADGEMAAE
jgi:hypothetical protein